MKKLLSLILAIAMVISLIPSVFADDTTTAPADVVYDFSTLTTIADGSIDTLGFEISGGGTYGQTTQNWKTGLDISKKQVGLRVPVNTKWESQERRSDKAAINIKVTEPGWYSLSFTGGLTVQGFKASIYLLENQTATENHYLGDYDFTYDGTETTSNEYCVVGTEKKLNSVYLTKGTHTIVFCFRAGVDGGCPFFINFKLYGLSAEPIITEVKSDVPAEILNIGEVKNLTAQVLDSNGDTVSYADYAIKGNVVKGSENTTTYLKITSDNDGVVQVSNVAKGGLCNSENTNYSIEAIGGGVANLIFTPYINGVAQTSYTKSVSVEGPITVDFSKSEDKANKTPGYTVGPYGQSSDSWRKSKCGTMMRVLQVHQNYTTWHEQAKKQNMLSFKVNVPEAGFYNIKLQGGLTVAGGIMSIYANGNYAGDYDFHTDDTTLGTNQEHGVVGPEKALNTVYLSSGENIIFMGLRKSLSIHADTRIFLRKLTLTPVDSLAGETAIDVKTVSSTDVPATMTVEDSIDATATVTMEDDSVRSFAEYKLSGTTAVADTIDSVTVTSSAPAIISVENVEDDALGASDKTTFTLRANAAGSADIRVTAKVGESTKTATYTVTASEYNPNDITTNPNVSVYIVAENADSSLISVTQGGVTAGNVGGEVARGTTITATATSNESYQFLYWMDNAKRYIQDDATYTFTAGTNTAVWAVYADKTDNLKLYDYFTDYGTRVYSIEAESEDGVTAPDPEMTGYTGGTWKKSIDNDEYVTFTPDWESATKSTVSVTLDGKSYAAGSYGDDFTVEKTLDGFVSWMKNGKLVSYNDKYTFFAWDEEEALVQSAEGEKSAFPGVVLFNDGSKYMLELVNCEGVEIVEKGILFDGTIDSCQKKFVSRTDLSQFTIVEDTLTNAKAYVIYKDGTDLRVAYSD